MNNRRKSPFVYHSVQGTYLKLVVCAIFGPTLLVAGCLYYLIWQTVAYELVIPELIYDSLLPAYHRVNQTLLMGLPIVCGLILFFAIQISHRLAGPLDRIERELDDMIHTGNFEKPIRLRAKDELHRLVKKINQALRTARAAH